MTLPRQAETEEPSSTFPPQKPPEVALRLAMAFLKRSLWTGFGQLKGGIMLTSF